MQHPDSTAAERAIGRELAGGADDGLKPFQLSREVNLAHKRGDLDHDAAMAKMRDIWADYEDADEGVLTILLAIRLDHLSEREE